MSISLQSSSTWDVADASQNPAQSSPEMEKAAKSPEGSEVSSEFFTEYFFQEPAFISRRIQFCTTVGRAELILWSRPEGVEVLHALRMFS